MRSALALAQSLNQAIDRLRKAKRAGKISHWEIETDDTSKGIFRIRVSRSLGTIFDARVSAYHHGRDLRSCADRAITEVSK